MAGVFITGTGTDVGKTVFAKALYNHLTKEGLAVAYMKPVQTGVGETGSNTDYQTVVGDDATPEHENTPYKLTHGVSPHLAQRMERDDADIDADIPITISMEHIVQCYKHLASKHNIVIVEGAGGACSPMDDGTLNIDLIARMEIPAIVVMHNQLGAIHSTIATLSAMHNIRREVSIMGFVANHMPTQNATVALHATVAQNATVAQHQDNIQTIENFSAIPCIAQMHGTKMHGTKMHGTKMHGTKMHGTKMHGDTAVITHGDKLFTAITRVATKYT